MLAIYIGFQTSREELILLHAKGSAVVYICVASLVITIVTAAQRLATAVCYNIINEEVN